MLKTVQIKINSHENTSSLNNQEKEIRTIKAKLKKKEHL